MKQTKFLPLGGLVVIIIGVLVALGAFRGADATDARCKGKTDDYCRALMVQDCTSRTDAYTQQRATERAQWLKDHPKQDTPAWTADYQAFVQSQNAQRRDFTHELAQTACGKYLSRSSAAGATASSDASSDSSLQTGEIMIDESSSSASVR
jgi:hypothetical protein